MTTELAVMDTKALESESSQMLAIANSMTIETKEDYESSTGALKDLKQLQAKVKETFDPVVDAAHKSHKAAVAARDSHLKPLTQAEQIIKGKAGTYLQAEDAKRREIIRQQEEAAYKARREEEERRRVEADKIRKENEARAAAAAAQAAALKREGDEAAAKQAEEAERKRKFAADIEAAEIEAAPIVAPIVQAPPPATEKIKGVSTNSVTRFEIIDAAAVPREFCKPDETLIRKKVNADGAACQIPGVRVWQDVQLSIRAK